ncbi:30S ribosomal protein 3 [Hibiscus syriacus]|uniref:30S ribosomal protein 3 n=1 Tax=Hibiscus syriacus TaxID=106335 RepID=A0A6A2Y8H3_HIBSY|nr:30S ribosomal protein 3-1, chloroplastic-like [Hibiscus syriacus]KAE8667617.1 30S ribosomal protein 3 [Hibiscus syriacus]
MLSMATLSTTFPLHYFGQHRSSFTTICFKASPSLKRRSAPTGRLTASAALTAETYSDTEAPPITAPQKSEVAVKQVAKPRLVLKFIWMEKNIGLALDQVIPGDGTVPLSPYFFWPRKDAWEELKATLESKPWISQKKMIILLNQATDIINLWQQSGGNLSQS